MMSSTLHTLQRYKIVIFVVFGVIILIAVGGYSAVRYWQNLNNEIAQGEQEQIKDTDKRTSGQTKSLTDTKSTAPTSNDEKSASAATQPKNDTPSASSAPQTPGSQTTKPSVAAPAKIPSGTVVSPSTSPPPSITVPVLPPSPVSPSGQFAVTNDLGVWRHIFYDDFTKNAAVGSWGEDWDADKIVYTGAQGQQWRAYPKSYKDTYDKRPYRSDKVLSVQNGLLNFHLHSVDGQPAGANPSPLIKNGSQYQTYGRYSARLRVDNPNLNEYYVAWLLWPQTEVWPDDGEIDFPEGSLAGTASAFHHYAGSGSYGGCRPNCQAGAGTSAKFTDWHTYTVEWAPNFVKFYVDGQVILSATEHIPNKPMRWQLQTETKGLGSGNGNLMVDWVSVWEYRG